MQHRDGQLANLLCACRSEQPGTQTRTVKPGHSKCSHRSGCKYTSAQDCTRNCWCCTHRPAGPTKNACLCHVQGQPPGRFPKCWHACIRHEGQASADTWQVRDTQAAIYDAAFSSKSNIVHIPGQIMCRLTLSDRVKFLRLSICRCGHALCCLWAASLHGERHLGLFRHGPLCHQM